MANARDYPHVFRLRTLDGDHRNAIMVRDILREWMRDQGIEHTRVVAVEYDADRSLPTGTPRHVRISMRHETQAFWFKMRWSTDCAAFALVIRLHAEQEEEWQRQRYNLDRAKFRDLNFVTRVPTSSPEPADRPTHHNVLALPPAKSITHIENVEQLLKVFGGPL